MSRDSGRKLKFLFAHNGYLGQFEYFAPWLKEQGHDVVVLHRDKVILNPPFSSVKFNDLDFGTRTSVSIAREAENALITAASAASAAIKLRDGNQYTPDVIMAHCGWGTGLMLKGVWPEAVYIAYHEWFYRPDAEFVSEPIPVMTDLNIMEFSQNLGRNFPIIAEFINADACWSPNEFQKAQFPSALRDKITVMHDGVDIELFKPNADATIQVGGLTLTRKNNVVTYVSRGFEPVRKFPEFMRAVKLVQNRMPDVHFVIVGENRVAYGNQIAKDNSWLHIMLDELDLDLSKVHFYGYANKDAYINILQASSAHIYMTDPFVLSWSFFEALATGCTVVSTDRRPVKDFIKHGKTGFLAKRDDDEDLAEKIISALSDKKQASKVGNAARKYICDNFSLDNQGQKRVAFVQSLLDKWAPETSETI